MFGLVVGLRARGPALIRHTGPAGLPAEVFSEGTAQEAIAAIASYNSVSQFLDFKRAYYVGIPQARRHARRETARLPAIGTLFRESPHPIYMHH